MPKSVFHFFFLPHWITMNWHFGFYSYDGIWVVSKGWYHQTKTNDLLFFFLFRVYVAESLISSAGEGLFSKVAAGPSTVMSFYNGVRITHQEVSGVEVGTQFDWLKGFVSHTLNFLISPFTLMFTKNIKGQKTRLFIKLVRYHSMANLRLL